MRLVSHEGPTHVLALDPGEEVVAAVARFCADHGYTGARFEAIGAFERAVLAFFELERRDYLHHRYDEQLEVAALLGNVAMAIGVLKVHAHAVLGRRDGSAVAGHLIEGVVRPTLELVLTAMPPLEKHPDPATGLALFNPQEGGSYESR